MKSRSSLLALAHRGGPGKRAVKWLWCGKKYKENMDTGILTLNKIKFQIQMLLRCSLFTIFSVLKITMIIYGTIAK